LGISLIVSLTSGNGFKIAYRGIVVYIWVDFFHQNIWNLDSAVVSTMAFLCNYSVCASLRLKPFFMRHIFTLLILVTSLVVRGQEYRYHSDSSGVYLVQYNIDELAEIFVPAVAVVDEDGRFVSGGSEHYSAWITVYKIQKQRGVKSGLDTIMVGKPFRGQYVEGGCFEDRPEDMVSHAKKLQSEMKKPKR
jgi:hypothetical protein